MHSRISTLITKQRTSSMFLFRKNLFSTVKENPTSFMKSPENPNENDPGSKNVHESSELKIGENQPITESAKIVEEKTALDSPVLSIPEEDFKFIQEKSRQSVASPPKTTPNEMQGIWQAYGPIRAAKTTADGQIAAAKITANGQKTAATINVTGAMLTSGVIGVGLYMLQGQASDQRKKADEAVESLNIKDKELNEKNEKLEETKKQLDKRDQALAKREEELASREKEAEELYSTSLFFRKRFDVCDTQIRKNCKGDQECLNSYDSNIRQANDEVKKEAREALINDRTRHP